MACRLRTVLMSLNDWKFPKKNVCRHVNIMWNSNLSVGKCSCVGPGPHDLPYGLLCLTPCSLDTDPCGPQGLKCLLPHPSQEESASSGSGPSRMKTLTLKCPLPQPCKPVCAESACLPRTSEHISTAATYMQTWRHLPRAPLHRCFG